MYVIMSKGKKEEKIKYMLKNTEQSKHFSFMQGIIAQSWLFFGCYAEKIPGGYHIGLAYLSMLLFTYFGSLYIILGR